MILACSGKCSHTRRPGTLVSIVPKGPRISPGASGLGSHVSMWLGPPESQKRITEVLRLCHPPWSPEHGFARGRVATAPPGLSGLFAGTTAASRLGSGRKPSAVAGCRKRRRRARRHDTGWTGLGRSRRVSCRVSQTPLMIQSTRLMVDRSTLCDIILACQAYGPSHHEGMCWPPNSQGATVTRRRVLADALREAAVARIPHVLIYDNSDLNVLYGSIPKKRRLPLASDSQDKVESRFLISSCFRTFVFS